MEKIILVCVSLALASCGVDTLSSTATGAASKAEEIKQGKKTEEKIKQDLDAALRAGQARDAEAEKANSP